MNKKVYGLMAVRMTLHNAYRMARVSHACDEEVFMKINSALQCIERRISSAKLSARR